MSEDSERFVVQARLLGEERATKKRRAKYAIEVVLSDESQYTTYRSIKEIANFHTQLMSKFPVEAGYFNKAERVIPECPLKLTIFGPSRTVSNDAEFERQLVSYIKALPGLPVNMVKSDMMQKFFVLRSSDFVVPGQSESTVEVKTEKKPNRVKLSADEPNITHPVELKSYYTVTEFSEPKSGWSFPEGAVVQVIQKDPGGWWMVDYNGKIGWAPASFLVPMDEELEQEDQEDKPTIGSRHISMSSYQASRDDELSFVKGAVVRVKKKYADGWWLVRYNGGEGLVPGALFHKFDRRQSSVYVKGIRRKYKRTTSTTIIPTIKPNWMFQQEHGTPENAEERKGVLYHVVENYSSSGSNGGELVLKKGAVVTALDKKGHGWWYVEDRHGRRGWAPATYLKSTNRARNKRRIVGTPHTVVQSHTAEREDELTVDHGTTVAVIWAADDGWWMVRNKETMKEGLIPSICLMEREDTCSIDVLEVCREEDENQDEPEEKGPCAEDFDNGSSDDLGAVDGDINPEECYVAAVDYVAQSIDELDLDEGETVCVIDGTAKDYWYVNVDGKEGWVPSNVLDGTNMEEELSTSARSSRRGSYDTPGYISDEDVDQHERVGPSIPGCGTRRNTLSPMVLRRSKSAQTHTGMAQGEQRRRGNSIGECKRSEIDSAVGQFSPGTNRGYISPSNRRRYKRPDFTHFKREVPPLPPTLNKLGYPAPKDENSHSPYNHRKLGRSESDHPQMNRLSEEALRRRGSEPPLPTIMVGNKSLDELEKEAAEAERTALEAQRRAQALRELVQRERVWRSENACAPDT